MINIIDKPNIDNQNKIERNIDGCKVRLFFSLKPNEQIERLVIDNIMFVFDHKMQALSTVKS